MVKMLDFVVLPPRAFLMVVPRRGQGRTTCWGLRARKDFGPYSKPRPKCLATGKEGLDLNIGINNDKSYNTSNFFLWMSSKNFPN